ncbi:amino acid ABC transporter substrate-binding protein [Sansalvadorimonas sp. 2012CJ34-2]|uniref:Amino acid ABC transporter substrate-binding protein n=1 Tax=Parendozoicomonas callyspongiae TaxID=2942213 RepID=A0ABT0PB55_9GAMM|nr:amino acid ABC transporter substrate-binding protein [Sansalvadorimonas sp. 2012CJ34-2]MCL6268508.1 amino acid ABC transporter substrate-binding protein [Sansalvadorimonas sp. 2012CJ34-2]
MKKLLQLAGATLVLAATADLAQAATLDTVKERGYLQCGVSTGVPGFSNPDDKGNWTGIDVDVCRAMAAAALGDAAKVKYVPLTAKERFTALQSGEIDVLSRNTTWTQTRDTSLGLNFVGVNYYDGQGFMVNKNLGVKSALELDGATVCIQAGTTTELNLADYFRENDMTFQPVVFDTSAQSIQSFETGRCDVLTSDQSQLYALRTKLAKPSDAVVLPEVISKEPLGPVVRQGDDQWLNIAKWSLYALINAEELGLNSSNIDSKAKSKDPAISRFLGKTGTGGKGLALPDDFAYQVIKQVGSYDEVFERNIGSKSPLLIERGINALWTDGGIVYAPPFR